MVTRPRGLLVVLSGPSGVGKGTVVAAAMDAPTEAGARVRCSISVTTRPARLGEVEGENYFFRTEEEFARMVEEGALLEWATYLGHRYGTPRGWVDQELAAGRDVVLEIEVQGAMQVREGRPEAVLVYLLPPSRSELEARLSARGSDSEETQRQRLEVAKEEIGYVSRYDYVIVNDYVDQAADRLLAILEAERWRVSRLDLSEVDWAGSGGERVK